MSVTEQSLSIQSRSSVPPPHSTMRVLHSDQSCIATHLKDQLRFLCQIYFEVQATDTLALKQRGTRSNGRGHIFLVTPTI